MSFGPIERAQSLLQKGDKDGVVKVLTPIVKSDRDDWEAWLLLAKALPQPERALYAVDQVLRLKPDHQEARTLKVRLAPSPVDEYPFPEIMPPPRVTTSSPSPKAKAAPRRSAMPVLPKVVRYGCFVIVALVMVAATGFGIYVFQRQQQMAVAAEQLTRFANNVDGAQEYTILYSAPSMNGNGYCFITTPVSVRDNVNAYTQETHFVITQGRRDWLIQGHHAWDDYGCPSPTGGLFD